MVDDNQNNDLDIALELVAAALTASPDLAAWLRKLIEGQTDPLALRVRDILAEDSKSRIAQRDLGG